MDGYNFINGSAFFFGLRGAECFIATATMLPHLANAQMDKVRASMAALKAKTAKSGPPKIEGTEAVAGKDVPALYFGTTKLNNNFDVVDEVVKENGGTATLLVKAGDEYVRVATNVKKADGSRAIGTILDPQRPGHRGDQEGRGLLWRRHSSQVTIRFGMHPVMSSAYTMSPI
jgi:hypothetical protein